MMEIGDVDLDYLGHSGFSILCKMGVRIVVDPCNIANSRMKEKADIVLITHGHRESCSIKDIERVVRDDGKKFYCCLGVLCQIKNLEENILPFGMSEGIEFKMNDSHSFTDLPYVFAKYVELYPEHERILMNMNDSGSSFNKIADWIEENL